MVYSDEKAFGLQLDSRRSNPMCPLICNSLRNLVGPPGFEPGTSCTPSKRASQAAPRPEKSFLYQNVIRCLPAGVGFLASMTSPSDSSRNGNILNGVTLNGVTPTTLACCTCRSDCKPAVIVRNKMLPIHTLPSMPESFLEGGARRTMWGASKSFAQRQPAMVSCQHVTR